MDVRKHISLGWFVTLLFVSTVLISCSNEDDSGRQHPEPVPHTEAVQELIKICNEHTEVKALLQHAIAQAASINPDRDYNPAQTLDEFYVFVDRNVRCLPWDVMIHPAPTDYGRSLYGRTDQGIGYFWFVVDQPLDELRDRGFFYPTIEFVEPFSSWLSTYSNCWGDWLNTEESWNDTYYEMVANDPDWGLDKGWRSCRLLTPTPRGHGILTTTISWYIRRMYKSRLQRFRTLPSWSVAVPNTKMPLPVAH